MLLCFRLSLWDCEASFGLLFWRRSSKSSSTASYWIVELIALNLGYEVFLALDFFFLEVDLRELDRLRVSADYRLATDNLEFDWASFCIRW